MRRYIKPSLIVLIAGVFSGAGYSADNNNEAVSKPPLLKVLSYNVNGLPPPIKKGKAPLYQRIAEVLRERRIAGTQPHVVLLQEAFDKRTAQIAETTGYKYVFKGPGRRDRSKKGTVHWTEATRKGYTQFKNPQKFTGSGLYILSDFPLHDAHYRTFDSDMCAGIDCLSNKAIQFVRLEVPFSTEPVDIINSHFNSRGSAKAPGRITLRMHQKQTDVLHDVLSQFRRGNPIVVAGDFNTKQDKRYAYFRSQIGLEDAGEICLSINSSCQLGEGTIKEEILYKTNDKQFYEGSGNTQLKPVWIGRNFNELLDGKPLSDHLGYEVHYRLTTND
ncbi:endonuclease/exonuclease/phosphatase family protein [Kordiimonas aquimaris]|uniref:endonuclease/exonuclease/phosphatase family protein n=1 Tax=Kordiimonas aquimaris TaxID=707591 RepID=UPI0021CEE81B|nr:endonuclease/exonuclease/phosphatase family protein [Kordiimonas aquimaris]